MTKEKGDLKDLTYEKAFSELEMIVEELENQQKTLEESLMLFERGRQLAKYCTDLLEKADLRIRQLDPNLNMAEDVE